MTELFDVLAKLIPGLAVVVGGPLAIYWWSRRGRPGSERRLRVADRAPFGKNSWVAVVEYEQRRFLVGVGEQGVSLISELEPLPEPAPLTEPTDAATTAPSPFGDETRPRMGLVRRLQLMTLRTPARPVWRPSRVVRR